LASKPKSPDIRFKLISIILQHFYKYKYCKPLLCRKFGCPSAPKGEPRRRLQQRFPYS
jgi:hypothetical protein